MPKYTLNLTKKHAEQWLGILPRAQREKLEASLRMGGDVTIDLNDDFDFSLISMRRKDV